MPLTRHAAKALAAAVADSICPKDTDLVFFGELGRDGRRRPYNFNRTWLNIKAKNGVSDLRFHDRRHEAVSRLVEGELSDQEPRLSAATSPCKC
ncbi:hypothetical protein [Rhodanobacter sp. PCA2]|uniref:hypothetical protein n=1 Tax=Rhodanobacter sp. PCA2 TaxID=2006117 RepID=UPI0031B83C0E